MIGRGEVSVDRRKTSSTTGRSEDARTTGGIVGGGPPSTRINPRHRSGDCDATRAASAPPNEFPTIQAFKVVSEIIFADDPPVPPPQVRTLIIWGANDRLPGSTIRTAQRLERSLPNAQLVTIPRAGHLPQVEQPEEFIRAVLDLLNTRP
jgi:pimeloyl-ACP methyl ester carboxylesterase